MKLGDRVWARLDNEGRGPWRKMFLVSGGDGFGFAGVSFRRGVTREYVCREQDVFPRELGDKYPPD